MAPIWGRSQNQTINEEQLKTRISLQKQVQVRVARLKHECSLEEKVSDIKDKSKKHYKKVNSLDADVDEQIENIIIRVKNNEGKIGWQCSKCNKYSKTKGNMKKHVEIHLEGLSFVCNYCDSVFKTSNYRNLHMYTSAKCKTKRNSGH